MSRALRYAVLLPFLAIAWMGGPPDVLSQEAEATGLTLQDRILAVVNEDTILQSDVEQVVGLGLIERREGESDEELRRRVLEGLIEQSLRFQQVGRFGVGRMDPERVEAQMRVLRDQYESDEAFREHLRRLGLTVQEVRQILARQMAVLDYVEERLGPRVFVGLEDIREYYESVLVAEAEERGSTAPPLAEVRETIRRLLKDRRLNEEIERWTEELRRQADVRILIDDYSGELPPVVERFEAPGVPSAGSSGGSE